MEEDDLVLCTVNKIEGTTVFVSLPDGKAGAITTSEIAAGRIRNLRDYVIPNKKIVCKVLRISQNHIDLSLRRVSSKEKKEVMDKFKQEQTAKSAIRSLLKEKAPEVEKKILADYSSLSEMLLGSKEDEKLIDKYFPEEVHEQIRKLTQKKRRGIEIKKIIKLKCLASDGLNKIRKILDLKDEKVTITYLAAGKLQVTLKADDYKTGNHKIDEIIETLEKKAKENSCEFSAEDKK